MADVKLCLNDSGVEIPAYAAVEPVGAADADGRLRMRKPTRADSTVVFFNGPVAVPAGGAFGAYPPDPTAVAGVDPLDMPLGTGVALGTKAGQWFLRKGGAGFRTLAAQTLGAVAVQADGTRPGTLQFLVKNTTTSTLPTGAVLAYASPAVALFTDFNARPAVNGYVPTSGYDDYCITLENAAPGEIVRALYFGLCFLPPATVILNGPGDYLACVNGSTTQLSRGTTGSARACNGGVFLGVPSNLPIYATLTSRSGANYAFTEYIPNASGSTPAGLTGTVTDGFAQHRLASLVDADLLIGTVVELQRFPGGHAFGVTTGRINWAFGPYYKVVSDITYPGFGSTNYFNYTYRMVLGSPTLSAPQARAFYLSGSDIVVA